LISPETIALVRDRTDIVALVVESVPSLKRRGRSWVGLCPFHKEKTGSFHVNADRGFFHCFGCKESGSAIDFVMKHEGATFPEAVRALAERSGIVIEEDARAPSEVDRQKKARDDLYTVNQLAATYFERELREHAESAYALEELARRGLVPSWARSSLPDRALSEPAPADSASRTATDDAIQAFRIGYAPSGWDGLARFLREQGVSPIAAETVGLLVPRSSGSGHYDRFRHRLMFAVIDPQGRVIAFSGRALAPLPGANGGQDGHEESKPAKYINSPESPIYSKGSALFGLYQARHAIRQAESATVVEGNFDVVSLHARGVQNVVAPLGTAFTVDQAKLLKRFTSNVVFLFDGDAAGEKAVRLASEPRITAGLAAKVASLPAGTDPDDLVRTRGPEALAYVLQCAEAMTAAFIRALLDAPLSAGDALGKLASINEIFSLIGKEPDPLVRAQLYVYADHQVQARLDIRGVDSLRAYREKLQKEAAKEAPRGPAGPSPRQARVAVREPGAPERAEIVGALIEFPELIDDPEVRGFLSLLEGASARTVAAISDSIRIVLSPPSEPLSDPGGVALPQKSLDSGSFLAQIPPPIQAFASERLAAPHHDSRDDAKVHLLENAQKLRRVVLGREANDLAREQYKATGDWQVETELAREAAKRVGQRLGVRRDD
jgi:DNA primase